MEKVIKIGNKSVKLSNNMAWAMEYKDQFGTDVIQDLIPVLASMLEGLAGMVNTDEEFSLERLAEVVEVRTLDIMLPLMQTEFMSIIINTTWSMAKTADENIDPPKQWIRQFDSFPLDVVVPTVYELAIKGFVSSKNLKRLMNLKKAIQPSHSKQSSSQESSED